ncbi:MAG: DJ-1 family glyoxalase III [Spirochaetota bacterium]
MAKRAIVCLADGFEEIEAITPIDLLKRAGVEVDVAGVGKKTITANHGLVIQTDDEFSKFAAEKEYDCIVLPGGQPGADNLAASKEIHKMLVEMLGDENKLVAAICAAPAVVLGKAGLLEGRKATCFPDAEAYVPDFEFSRDPVVIDGNLITSRGPGLAADFSFAVIERLIDKETADRIKKRSLYVH